MISSVASKGAGRDPFVCYGVSKAALDSFTRALAQQFSAEHGVTINSVAVGPTLTEPVIMAQAAGLDGIEAMAQRATAAKRLADVQDIAGIVGFLASDESRWINGNYVPANGGAMLELQG